MSDDKKGGAKSEAGKLFIDIGSTGLGTLIKGLNSLSATFMLAKNGAKAMADSLIKPAQEAGATAVEINKVANALGTSNKEVQKMRMYLKSKNGSEELINDIAQLKTIIYNVHTGLGQLPVGMSIALNRIGHNIMEYDGTFENTLKLLNDIQVATQGMSAEARNQTLQQMGISTEWAYLWSRGDFNLKDAALISDEAIEKNIEAAEAMAKLAATTEALKVELMGKIAPSLTTIANWMTDHELNFKEGKYNTQIKAGMTAAGVAFKGATSAKNITSVAKGFATGGAAPLLPIIEMPQPINNYNSTTNNTSIENNLNKKLDKETNLQTPENMQSLQDVPPQTYQNLRQIMHIEITNQNTINGENANEIVDKIISINSQDIAYNQFQAYNLAGL